MFKHYFSWKFPLSGIGSLCLGDETWIVSLPPHIILMKLNRIITLRITKIKRNKKGTFVHPKEPEGEPGCSWVCGWHWMNQDGGNPSGSEELTNHCCSLGDWATEWQVTPCVKCKIMHIRAEGSDFTCTLIGAKLIKLSLCWVKCFKSNKKLVWILTFSWHAGS